MIWLLTENNKYWHFATIFESVIEVRKSEYPNLFEAMNRARDKAFG
jgi:hypothetical protein